MILSLFVTLFHPHSGAKTEINGTDVRIFKIKSFKKKEKFHSFQTGLIFKKSKKYIYSSWRRLSCTRYR